MFDFRFVLQHDTDGDLDLVATLDERTTVGELVDRLVTRHPVAWRGEATLERLTRTKSTMARDAPVGIVDLQSGDVVRLAPDSGLRDRERSRVVGRARIVTEGHPARWIDIPAGETIIGRSASADVNVPDGLLSRRHAKLIASDVIEVVDLGSTNGTLVNGRGVITPRRLASGDEIRIGDTTIFVDQAEAALGEVPGPSIEFNRPPRLQRGLPEARIELPEPPQPPSRRAFPLMAAIAPLFMGILMTVLFPERGLLAGIFFLMSPVMIVGSVWDAKRTGNKDYAERMELYREDVDTAITRIERAQDTEVEARFDASPPVGQLHDVARNLTARLWEREPGDPDFLEVRLGLAPQAARTTIEMPRNGPRDLMEELAQVPRRYAVLPPVPVRVNLATTGSIGVAGPEPFRWHVARSVVAQLATLQSPSEVVVAALLGDGHRGEWDWLKWLPHTRAPLSPISGPHLAATVDDALAILTQLGAIIEQRRGDGGPGKRVATTPHVVVVVDDDLALERPRLTGLLEAGPSVGIHVVWVAASARRIPKTSGAVVAISPGGATATVSEVEVSTSHADVPLELLDGSAATRLARDLAPVVDVSSRQSREAGLPSRSSLVDLIGGPVLLDDAERIRQRWGESTPGGGLRAAVGAGASGVFSIDLRHDGPHGLVAGTTGAGKSEFLQSLLVALAATHSPDKVNFLLVDYKGGAAFKDVTHLPHTVGLVTDLTRALVTRALTSLRAELHRREHLLNQANAKDQLQMEREGHPLTPPSLVIVVDEFAALANEVPEFVDGVVDIAQRGRSLGLHLLLATQRPAGVITPNIRANTNLKVALRVASDAESQDVLDSPIAATIDRSTPGRGVARLGPSELLTFQSGYVGGHTSDDDAEETQLDLATFGFSRVQAWPRTATDLAEPRGPNDLERLVATITTAFEATGRPRPRRPWLDPLADHYDLLRLPRTGRDDAVAIGVRDVPEQQSQAVASFRPDRDGSLLVYGMGGTGKSVALRTVAAACCLTDTDHPVGILGIDAAGRGLDLLSPLPQVGTIVASDDYERVTRLLGDLRDLVDQRNDLFGEHRAGTLAEYRANSGVALQRILVLVDGYDTFAAAWERTDVGTWLDLVIRLVRDGRAVGVHFALSGVRRSSFPMAITSSVGRRLVLRLATMDEYANLGVDGDLVDGDEVAGRAVDGETTVQVAMVGTDPTTAGQAATLRRLGATLAGRDLQAGPEVRILEAEVPRRTLEPSTTRALSIGLTPALTTFRIPVDQDLLVAGPARSGKTTTVATIVLAARDAGAAVLPCTGGRPLPEVDPAVQHRGADAVVAALEGALASTRSTLVVVDDVDRLLEGPADAVLKKVLEADHLHLVVACDNALARSSWADVMTTLKRQRRVLLLQPDPTTDGTLANADLPRVRRPYPPGRAIHADGGNLTTCQVALP